MAEDWRPVSRLDITGPAHIAAERWRKWRRSLEFYLAGQDINNPAWKRSLLLHYTGTAVQDIYKGLQGTEDEDENNVYVRTATVLEDHFRAEPNIPFERYAFRQMSPKTQWDDGPVRRPSPSTGAAVWLPRPKRPAARPTDQENARPQAPAEATRKAQYHARECPDNRTRMGSGRPAVTRNASLPREPGRSECHFETNNETPASNQPRRRRSRMPQLRANRSFRPRSKLPSQRKDVCALPETRTLRLQMPVKGTKLTETTATTQRLSRSSSKPPTPSGQSKVRGPLTRRPMPPHLQTKETTLSLSITCTTALPAALQAARMRRSCWMASQPVHWSTQVHRATCWGKLSCVNFANEDSAWTSSHMMVRSSLTAHALPWMSSDSFLPPSAQAARRARKFLSSSPEHRDDSSSVGRPPSTSDYSASTPREYPATSSASCRSWTTNQSFATTSSSNTLSCSPESGSWRTIRPPFTSIRPSHPLHRNPGAYRSPCKKRWRVASTTCSTRTSSSASPDRHPGSAPWWSSPNQMEMCVSAWTCDKPTPQSSASATPSPPSTRCSKPWTGAPSSPNSISAGDSIKWNWRNAPGTSQHRR